ncbi:hypothetical protein Ae263Ps1_5312c [Pseudonocardia sp. Ae263_Ps1]|nr:hypothetical protein Ae263Ps1_5312c [Pseudonocardia sp. Ae263_Ps1]OLL91718.1 hypothetical protein Ae356Ps1_1615 [Pseudonocardia sp. Ae356_Ps1]
MIVQWSLDGPRGCRTRSFGQSREPLSDYGREADAP